MRQVLFLLQGGNSYRSGVNSNRKAMNISLFFITAKCKEFYWRLKNQKSAANCYSRCPQGCIRADQVPCVIGQEHCLHCGNGREACPYGAVEFQEVMR